MCYCVLSLCVCGRSLSVCVCACECVCVCVCACVCVCVFTVVKVLRLQFQFKACYLQAVVALQYIRLSFQISLFFPVLTSCPHNGELRTQKLKSHLVRAQSLNVLPLKPGVDKYIDINATLTARDFFLVSTLPVHFFPKTSPDFSCVGCG